MACDKVKRNVVALCSIPEGQQGRPSKSLTLDQAKAVLAAEDTRLYAFVVLSLLTGAGTEELCALTWEHVDLTGRPDDDPSVPPSNAVWHSAQANGDTKTRKSRRTHALPLRCVVALFRHRELQQRDRDKAGKDRQPRNLVFASTTGNAWKPRTSAEPSAGSGLTATEWKPRELRYSFVSALSSSGVSLEDIVDLCGHSGTTVTGKVYRHQLRPVPLGGAIAMDRIFAATSGAGDA